MDCKGEINELMIIAYYEQGHSKRETANKFEIEPKQLRD